MKSTFLRSIGVKDLSENLASGRYHSWLAKYDCKFASLNVRPCRAKISLRSRHAVSGKRTSTSWLESSRAESSS